MRTHLCVRVILIQPIESKTPVMQLQYVEITKNNRLYKNREMFLQWK